MQAVKKGGLPAVPLATVAAFAGQYSHAAARLWNVFNKRLRETGQRKFYETLERPLMLVLAGGGPGTQSVRQRAEVVWCGGQYSGV